MKVLSSSPVSSSALKTSAMPSSTEAIIAARRRISSSVPACMPSSSLREAALVRSACASVQAGFCFTTSDGATALGRRGKCSPL